MADTVIASGSNSAMDDLPLWLQASGGDPALSYTATADRSAIDALFTAEGPIGSSAFAVTQRGAGANFSVDVAGGYAVITGDSVSGQGKYLIHSTGTVNVTTPAAPGAVNRTHRVIARIRDKQAAGTSYDWTLELLEDPNTGTPALPASAITLATVGIAVGQANVGTANITDGRKYAYLPGALILVRNQAERDALTASSGLRVWRIDVGRVEYYSGSKWLVDSTTVKGTLTNYTSTTSQTAVTGMTFTVEANSVYALDMHAMVFGVQNVGVNLGFSLPASATMDGHTDGFRDSDGAFIVNTSVGATTVSQLGSFGYSVTANTSPVVGKYTIITGASAGSVTLVAAQRVSSAVTSSVVATSWMRYQQIG